MSDERLAERDAWVVLAATSGVGPEVMGALLAEFGSAADVLEAATRGTVRRFVRGVPGQLGRAAARREVLAGLEGWRGRARPLLDGLHRRGLWTVTPLDADFPRQLGDLDPAPALLVGSGERGLLGRSRMTGVVGTRRPTPAGRALAASVARRLVECDSVVVSGLAVGIDGVAHSAALEHGGATVAVIGGGHDHPGPNAHAALRRQIVERGGAIVSEHAPDVVPGKGTYPRRNRIIAGLAAHTIVVEAPARSGALITAHHALELGRPVLVAPGRVGDWATAGSLALLRETPARVLSGIDEMTADLGYFATDARRDGAAEVGAGLPSAAGALALLSGAERAVAERLRGSPAGLDVLVDATGLPPATVSGAVTMLLIRGWVQPVGPAYVVAGPLLG